jgi:hypothetical protein
MAGRALLRQFELEVGGNQYTAGRVEPLGVGRFLTKRSLPGDADAMGVFITADKAPAMMGQGFGQNKGIIVGGH